MTRQSYWYREKKNEVHDTVFGLVRFLEDTQSHRSAANLEHMSYYDNQDLAGLTATTYSKPVKGVLAPVPVVKMCADTVHAKMTKNKPRPLFLTSGGDYSLKTKAKKLTKFCDGLFYGLGLYELGGEAFLDGTVFGTGAVKFYEEDGAIKAERTFIDELIVDDAEAVHGNPRSLYQKKAIARDVLRELFPKHAAAIDNAEEAEMELAYARDGVRYGCEMVNVVEAWHLPTSSKSKDGRHVICISGATLVDEVWEENHFPFAFIKWSKRSRGFYGQGQTEMLIPLQRQLNNVLKIEADCFRLGAIPKIFVDATTRIVKTQLDNTIGGVVHYTGTKPESGQLGIIPREIGEYKNWLYEKIFEVSGVSILSSQSKKPAGLDSGKALREFNDIESERFTAVGQAYEQFYIDCAKICIALSRKIYKRDKKFQVTLKGRKFLETIEWGQIDMEDDQYMMQIMPASSLPRDPAGRFEAIEEYVRAGYLSREAAIKLLDMPDIESEHNLITSAIEDIEWAIDKIVDEADYVPPEPYQNLKLGITMFQATYLRARREGVPEDRLDMLRTWMAQADAEMKKIAPQSPLMGPAPGAPSSEAIARTQGMASMPVMPGAVG